MRLIFRYTLLLVMSGCSGDNTTSGNPLVSLSIQATQPGSLSASSFNFQPVSVQIKDSSGSVVGSLSVSSARVALKEIEFELEGAEDQEIEIDFKGPFVVDLMQNTVSPSLNQIELIPGLYKEVHLKIDRIDGDELDSSGESIIAPSDPLFGNSIYIGGLYTGPSSAGAQIDAPFEMAFDLDDELELTGASDTSLGFQIESEQTNALILAFRMSKWLEFNNTETNSSNLNPSQIELISGEVKLNETSTGVNAQIRRLIYDNIKKSLDYGKDSNQDGKLDADEDDDPDEEDVDDD